MTFQLVRASDDEIAVWQTEHGHIYGFTACPDTNTLKLRFMRDAPEAAQPAQSFAAEALRFATAEARARLIIGGRAERRRRSGCAAEPV